MTMNTSVRAFSGVVVLGLILIGGYSSARAAGEYVQIQNVSPVGAINPGTMVSFVASASGFVDPVYAVTDSFSASGATVGTVDKVGYFTWTPSIYDAGMHTITITVTDAVSHSATASASILVASNSIIVSSLSPGPVVAVRRPITFTVTAPGFVSPTYAVYDSYSASTLTSGNINSLGAFSWTPTSDDLGTHRIIVQAYDIYGHAAQTVVNVTVINPTVSIQSLKPGSAAGIGSAVSFSARANSLTKPAYSVSDSFTGTSTIAASDIDSLGAFSWTPTAADLGFHTLTVTASDAYGNAASSSVMISITNAPATQATAPAAPVVVSASGASSSAATVNRYVFTSYLGIGSRGTIVLELQNRLTDLGFYTGPVTGYFGPLTSAGVKRLQAAHGIEAVGFVGPQTRAALNG